MTTREPVEHCRQYIEGWLPGAMYPSEIAWFLENFRRSGCDVLIECGRQDGVSTEAFASYFAGTDVKLISIDFDRDPARAGRARERVRDYDVELVSGDLHAEVPKALERCAGRRVGVLQDGAKGWEGLATLLAAAVASDVTMVAQHNLHEGHRTRCLFQILSRQPSFIEHSDAHDRFRSLIDEERATISTRNPNRPLDHTSLGVMLTDPAQKRLIVESFELLKPVFGPWNPARAVEAWQRKDFGYVARQRRRARFSLALFKAR